MLVQVPTQIALVQEARVNASLQLTMREEVMLSVHPMPAAQFRDTDYSPKLKVAES